MDEGGKNRLWSWNSNFKLRFLASKFGPGSRMIWPIENWKPLYYLYNSLAPHKLGLWNRNPSFRVRLHIKVFGSGSGHPTLLGSTALVKCRPECLLFPGATVNLAYDKVKQVLARAGGGHGLLDHATMNVPCSVFLFAHQQLQAGDAWFCVQNNDVWIIRMYC